MKSVFLKTLLVINLFFIYNCKAQTNTNDYITFYNDVVPKLNSMVPNKTQYYGQNFSNFYNELQNKNITIVMLGYGAKIVPDTKNHLIYLYFCDASMLGTASENSYNFPWVVITFQQEIPNQIKSLVSQYHGLWNTTFAQFFSNIKIEKIDFIGIKGYDVEDYSE